MIEVKEINAYEFLVIVDDKNSKTEYNVKLDDKYYQKLTAGRTSKGELIKKSFKFLLEREPKESIFSVFNLEVIKKYFPEYDREMKKGE